MKKLLIFLVSFMVTYVCMSQIEQSTQSLIFGENMSLHTFVVFFGFALFGLFGSVVFDLYELKPNVWSWLKVNYLRLLLSVFVVVCGVLFGEELVGMELSNWSAFLAGFTSDKLIDKLLSKRKKDVK